MLKDLTDADMSEMEREFELEMDGDQEIEEGELEFEFESGGEEEYETEEPLGEFEESDTELTDYAERFFELSQREYESESEIDEELNGLLNEIEQEYFFGGIGKKLKKAGKSLIKKGLKAAAGHIPAFKALQAVTQLSRGNLKGMLASLAKAGLGSVIPGGAAVLPALQALGFQATDDPEANKEAWNNYVEVARESFDYLAGNLTETADQPLEASRLATTALQRGLRSVQSRLPSAPPPRSQYPAHRRRATRVIRLRRGQRIVIKAE